MTIPAHDTHTFGTRPTSDHDRRSIYLAGARAAAPLLLGVTPFGLVYGVAAVDAGFHWSYVALSSLLVFAGASQMAVTQMLQQGAPLLVAFLAALVINLRMLLYSASIAPHFQGLSLPHKGLLAYFLTDQAYAVSMAGFAGKGAGLSAGGKAWYYLGGGMCVWAGFEVGTLLGAVLGAELGGHLPQGLQLNYAVPLTFLALLAPLLCRRESVFTALASGATALAFRGLPWNLGLPLAIAVGIAVWRLLHHLRQKEVRPC